VTEDKQRCFVFAMPGFWRLTARLEIAAEERSHDLGVILDNMQRAILEPIAERNNAAHPHPLLFGGGDLVPDPLACDLPLELGEGQQHVERRSPHAGCGVEGLGHRDERDVVLVEHLDEFGEVGKRAGQPIDLVDVGQVRGLPSFPASDKRKDPRYQFAGTP
jgi:hypothetical protein